MAISAPQISPRLRYEAFAGRTLYRKGTSEVLNGQKTHREIMGSSSLQALIVSLLYAEISKHLSDEYIALVSEPGLHVAHNENFSNDIAIYRLDQIGQFDKQYLSVPPRFVIEVDVNIDIDLSGYVNQEDYIFQKTQALLDFGVETVVWVTTEGAHKIMVAQGQQDWRVTNWNSLIEFAPNVQFSFQELIERRGISGRF